MTAQIDTQGRVRVVIADKWRLTSQMLSELLRSDNRFDVWSAAGSLELLHAVTTYHPHVAVLGNDLDDTPFKGYTILKDLQSLSPGLRSVMLLDHSTAALVVEAFRNGCQGVFCRDDSFADFPKCIYSVYSGQVWANSSQLHILLRALVSLNLPPVVDARGKVLLSPRENEICRYVVEGLTNREISLRLSISQHTVKNHIFKIFEKLGVSNRVELVMRVTRSNGAVVPDIPVTVVDPKQGDGTAETRAFARSRLANSSLAARQLA